MGRLAVRVIDAPSRVCGDDLAWHVVVCADVATRAEASISSHVAPTSMRGFTLRRETRMATIGRVGDCAHTSVRKVFSGRDGVRDQVGGSTVGTRFTVDTSWRIMQVQHELRRSVAFRFVVFAAPTVQCVSAQHRGGGSARLPHFCCNVSPLGSHARCGRGAATSWPLDAHAPFAGPRDAPVLSLDRAMRRSVSPRDVG